jgi:hypothetical protein
MLFSFNGIVPGDYKVFAGDYFRTTPRRKRSFTPDMKSVENPSPSTRW